MRLIASAAALVGFAVAAVSATASTTSQEHCFTALATNQAEAGTTTRYTTLSFTRSVISVSTPTQTITPTSLTVTTESVITSSTTTTVAQQTSTFYSTSTLTSTTAVSTTITTTSTFLVTTTATSTYPTSTIEPSAGFVPLASALDAEGDVATKKKRRYAAAQRQKRGGVKQIVLNPDGSLSFFPPQFYGEVTCNMVVEVIYTSTSTMTGFRTTTITAPQGTVTSTIYSTTTDTITATPTAASTTVFDSTTSTTTTTSTFTETTSTTLTTTTTSYAPAPTYYAACSANNTVSFVNGNFIVNIAVSDPNNGFTFGNDVTNPYDCCTQCIISSTCGGYTYHPGSGECYHYPFGAGQTCSPTEQSGSFLTDTGTGVGFVVGDSNCGELSYGGQK